MKTSSSNFLPVLPVIAGPTGSGKSGLAVELALQNPIEVISADSRTVYKWLDIGTAKPSMADRRGVAHHMFDVVSPFESYSAGQFREDVIRVVPQILGRGNIPVVVGGSGLYIKALEDLFDRDLLLTNPELRQMLNSKKLAELHALAALLIPELLTKLDENNPRRLIRALEKSPATYKHFGMSPTELAPTISHEQPCWSSISLLSIERDRAELHSRIKDRSQEQWHNGILIEAGWLISTGLPLDAPAFTGTGYRDSADFLTGAKPRSEAFEANVAHNRQLARRQLTWLKHQHANRVSINITGSTESEALKLVANWFKDFSQT